MDVKKGGNSIDKKPAKGDLVVLKKLETKSNLVVLKKLQVNSKK